MTRKSRHAGQFGRTLIALAVTSCFAAPPAFANPTGPAVANGQVTFHQQGNLLQITNSPNAIINWQSFSIGANEITRFLQQSASSAVLNRVITQNPSSILGALQSNGRVFLINPNGILFGAGAQVDVAGLVASTLNLSNADFLAGKLKFTEVPGAGSVVNQGTINATQGGQVYLIGSSVTNSGLITSPKGEVILAAGNSVELVNPGTPNLRVEISAPDNEARNLGTIVADAGRVGIYAGLINHAGTIRADSAQVTEDGRIVLKATRNATLEAGSLTTANGPNGGLITIQSGDTTLVSGTIEAKGLASPQGGGSTNSFPPPQGEGEGGGGVGKGGTIQVLGNLVGLIDNANISASGDTGGGTVLIGGGFQGKNPDVQNAFRTYFGADAMITADAIVSGDGGKVIVWSDDITRFYGTISARGGAVGGNGGFVEVSGKGILDFRGKADLGAPVGQAGTLLLDPLDITISDTVGTDNTQLDVNVPTVGDPAGSVFFADGGTATSVTISDEAIELQTANIVLQASRDITVNPNLSNGGLVLTTPGQRLTMQAGRHITIGSPVTTAGGAIILEADSPHAPVTASSDGRNPADRIGQVTINATVKSYDIDPNTGGHITLIAGGDRAATPVRSITNNAGFRIPGIVDAGAGGINLALSRSDVELGIGVTGTLTQILGNHDTTPAFGSIANLRTTGALVIGTATTAGTDGLGAGFQTLTVNKISNVFNNSYITLNPTTPASSFQLVAGSGGITLSEPLTTYQNTIITTTTGTLTINDTLATSNNNLTITANNIVGTQFINVGGGACSFNGGGCPGISTQVFWDGGAGTLNWFDQNNWSTDLFPTAGQDVTIGSGFGTIVVSGAAVAKSLIANRPLQLSSGSLTLTNASNFSDAFTLSGGSLLGAGGVTVGGANGSLTWSGGTMAGGGDFMLAGGRNGTLSGTLTLDRLFQNSGMLTLNSATVNTTGTGSIANAGLITVAGGPSSVVNTLLSNKIVDPILGTTILGTIQVNGSLTAANFPTNDGTINIASGGTLATSGNALTNAATGIMSGAGTLNLGSAAFTNSGTIRPGVSPGKLTITGDLNLSSTSVIDIELGGATQGVNYDWLAVSGSATLNGTMNVTETGGFQVSPGDNFQVITCGVACSGTFATISSPVDVSLAPATNPTNFALNAGGVIDRWVGTSGAWDVAGNWSRGVPTSTTDVVIDVAGSETVTVSTGAQAARTLTSQENLAISGGSLSLGSVVADVSTINGALDLSGGTLQNSGSLTVNGAFNWNAGALTGTGNVTVGGGGAFNVNGNSARALNGLTISAGNVNLNGGGLTLQSGTLNASGLTTIANGATMIAQGGTLNAAGGTIDIFGIFQAGAGAVTAGTMNVQAGGTLNGTGTVNANVNNVAGTVAPGTSPGNLTINGNYTQGPAGWLTVDIGGTAPGTQYDQLIVTGNVMLDGTLNVAPMNNYLPAGNEIYTIIQSGGTVSGAFATTNLPSTPTYVTAYYPSSVSVGAAGAPPNEQAAVAASEQSTSSQTASASSADPKQEEEKRDTQKKPVCTGSSGGSGVAAAARPVMSGGAQNRCTARGCF